MTLSEELTWRGLVNQTTLPDLKLLDTKKFKLYFGVDPSADSMTVGNLAAAMMVKAFLRHGHEVTLLVGGATGMIGDPSGKDAERNLLSLEQVANNKAAIAAQYKQVFSGQDFRLVDNYDWFKDINYLEFLRDVGKHFSMTPLLQRDYIATRIGAGGSGMSYAEFSYTLIQGYDFYHLNKTYDIDMQVCGSDQWGNSISGVELIRRKSGKEAHIYSVPLIINKATGKKFGKSEEGAVWLDTKKTSPTQFYQFWVNSDDEGVEEYLKVFTELGKEDIEHIMAEHAKNPQERLAQRRLAEEVTTLIHGVETATYVRVLTNVLTGLTAIGSVSDDVIDLMKKELPYAATSESGSIIEALVVSGLASSNSDARRLLAAKAVYINGVASDKDSFDPADFSGGRLLLRRGKALKDTALIEIQ